ncbi:BglG family transcription antiterminator [Neobacillus mesonae]|uniref:BglG family transcription antiterminator n=1 Tax=Neobacillus mesonae TaxID=1193713 RepID=UPI00203BEB5D|nr:BglG family transcription antiterminator [Neobacillus mesonae]MCM3570703.1 BglG family transcription antiterminator [Neobacillus mesonae]
MYITAREKAIIELILKTSGKQTAASIANYLNVSPRTVQRDLKAVEKVLNTFDLHLERNGEKGLLIEGKNERIFRLSQYLAGSSPINETPKEKKLQLLVALVQEEAYKIQALSSDIGVSVTTLTTYLDELTDWLDHFNVKIVKKRGVGIDIAGSESARRNALANYILLHFYDELFENLFLLEKGKFHQELVLHYFKPDYLLAIDRLVNTIFGGSRLRLADSDYIGFVVHICITMQRTEDFPLAKGEAAFSDELQDEYQLMMEIERDLEGMFPIQLVKEDIIYLAVILKGSKLQEADEISYDSIVLSKLVKSLIEDVSSQLHMDLTNDFSLYQGLLAHLEPAIYRIKQQIGFFNPLKEEIIQKYPILFMAVKNSMEKVLQEIGDFPDDELAYIVLHFGSALVMREEKLSIDALVVCPTGIGTSKMLASRIKKEIPGIDHIDIKSFKEVQRKNYLKDYDLIISTVKLPFLDVHYILVSPLLTEENIQMIKSFLRNNLETLTEHKRYAAIPEEKPRSKTGIVEVLQELKVVQESIEELLGNFRFSRISAVQDHEQIVQRMVYAAEKEGLLSNIEDVLASLRDRGKKGGLGIPGTGMALFHCRNRNVHKLVFQITHFEHPIFVRGMDGNDMPIKNLLLMLAPEELAVRQQEIVSLISTSLIESNEAILVFSSANEEMIRERLETIFLEYLHTNIIKE